MSTSSAYKFTKIDIVNHSVKVEKSELLRFFYPDFKVVENNQMIITGPVIYKGKVDYLNRIKDFGFPVISVTTLGEFDLSSNRTLVDLTFSKWEQEPPKRLVKYIDTLDYEELLQAVKIHWLTGKWTIKKYSKNGSFIKLAEAFGEGSTQVLDTYMNLLDNKTTSGAYIEKSLFSFLEKIAAEDKSGSYWYTKIMRRYSRGKRYLLVQAVDKYLRVNINNKDLKVFNLLQDLCVKDKTWTSE